MTAELAIDIQSGMTTIYYSTESLSVNFDVPLGSVSVGDKFFVADPPEAAELSAALSVIELYVDDFVRECGSTGINTTKLVASGHIADVAAVEVGDGRIGSQMDGYEFGLDGAEEVFRWIATESASDRSLNPGVAEGGEAQVLGAATILVEVMRQLDLEQIEVRLSNESS